VLLWFAAALTLTRLCSAQCIQGAFDLVTIQAQPLPALHPGRQFEGTECSTHQAAHHDAHHLEHASHQAITTFAHADAIPVIRPFAPIRLQQLEPCRAVVQRDLGTQCVHLLLGEFAQHSHRVVPAHLEARMRQEVRKLTGVGEHEQPAGVVVQTTDRQPPSAPHYRHAIEYAGAPLGVLARDDLALGFVVQHHLRHGVRAQPTFTAQRLACDRDVIVRAHARTDSGRLAIDADLPGADQFLHGPARPEPGLRQALLQLDGGFPGRFGRLDPGSMRSLLSLAATFFITASVAVTTFSTWLEG